MTTIHALFGAVQADAAHQRRQFRFVEDSDLLRREHARLVVLMEGHPAVVVRDGNVRGYESS